MKKIFLIIMLFIAVSSQAQVTKVTLQASGLTCSMCSNAINKALKSVDYVEKVMANIKQSSFEISFKPGANVSFDQLKKKVEDAGFFVAKFQALVQFENVAIDDNAHAVIGGTVYHFLNVKTKIVSGSQLIQVLDKGYVSAKEFKKNNSLTSLECYKTGVAGTCCIKSGAGTGARVYHITI